MSLVIVGEGQGEVQALPRLVGRLQNHLGLSMLPYPSERWSWRHSLVRRPDVEAVCEQVRALGACQALLLTRDADNKDLDGEDCPKITAPQLAEWVRGLNLPFPVGIVLFYKEYETLFLAGAEGMAGKPVRDVGGKAVAEISDVSAHPDPEYPRDAKRWVKHELFPGYKETLHQAALTKALDLDDLERSGLSSYRRLVNALRFLEAEVGVAGAVYPQPAEEATEHA